MNTFVKIFNWFVSIMQTSFPIYGYYISFWQIFVFLCIAGVCATLLHAILKG